MCRSNYVAFKGSKKGLTIYFNSEVDYASLKEQLIKKLESAKRFFEGATVISIQGKTLTTEEKEEITNIIHSKFGMIVVEKGEAKSQNHLEQSTQQIFDGIEEGNTKFIRATIRSGQSIRFDGNVIIIGDVNPGAEVIAGGNILVMGTLRGMAHAGARGNAKAYVAAFCLQPTQLRIANVIARSPDNEYTKPSSPELAMIKNNIVVIEPYLPKNK